MVEKTLKILKMLNRHPVYWICCRWWNFGICIYVLLLWWYHCKHRRLYRCYHSARKKFRELLPILCNKSIPMKCCGSVFSAGVCSVLLYASVTWVLTVEEQNRVIRNDNSMVRWICLARLTDRKPMSGLREDPEDLLYWRPFQTGQIKVVWPCKENGGRYVIKKGSNV